ncbi:MAG: hypothetical protein ABSG43_15715 [Solirubrobacteraceae bacterium]
MLVESRVRAGGRWCGGGGVLNLGEGGMLLERNSDLEVAKTVRFELCGADFRYTGHATVTHRDDGSIGLQFVTWDGDSMNRSVRALVAARLRGQQLPAQHAGNLAGAHAHARDAREDQRAAVSRLSAVIDGTPGATTRRHHILNAAKHGILIDGLIRPGVPVRNAARAANGDAPSRSSRAIGVHLEPLLVPNRSRKPLLRQDSTSP